MTNMIVFGEEAHSVAECNPGVWVEIGEKPGTGYIEPNNGTSGYISRFGKFHSYRKPWEYHAAVSLWDAFQTTCDQYFDSSGEALKWLLSTLAECSRVLSSEPTEQDWENARNWLLDVASFQPGQANCHEHGVK